MENENINSFPADVKPDEPDNGIFTLDPSESGFYQQMKESLNRYTTDQTTDNPLETLYNYLCRFNRLFIALGRPWIAESGEIQKACAYYLAYAGLTKQESNAFIETLNGFTSSACYLAEYNYFINRMQEYFCCQEKELKRLLDYQKEMKKKREERLERMNKGEIAYCITVGEDEIYGVTYTQLEELHRTIGIFIEREKAPFDCKIKGYDEYCISISKIIDLYADKDYFHVDYSLSTFESDLCCMSAAQMKDVADFILKFLKKFGEDGDKKVVWDMADYPENVCSKIPFCIKEDSRKPNFKAVPHITKYINQDDDSDAEISYDIAINEMRSPSISFREFIVLYRKLSDFLKKPVEA